jgi:hypothetical protein
LQDAAAQAQDLRLAGGVVQRLRDADHVALADEGNRGRDRRGAPTSSGTPASSAARFVSVFLTTVKRAPCLSTSVRTPSISGMVSPR